MKIKLLLIAILMTNIAIAQQTKQDSLMVVERLLSPYNTNRLTIGGYAQIDYNEPDGSAAGKLDVHRLVMLFGYKFSDKVSFLTEIEYEHVKEVYVEQAFVNYNVNPNFNIKGGLMLVPMGIVNEYHEPPTFYGVERPGVDHDIVPTTWREIGVGVSGKFDNLSLKYQAYIFNGFVSYKNGAGTLRGVDGLRKGRQKGAESIVSAPNLSMKFDYYGILGLKLGLSGYFGNTQTDDSSVDNSTVGVSMVGLDARYVYNSLELRGQYIYTSLSGTSGYNELTGKDLGSEMDGLYGEIAYDFMPLIYSNSNKKFVLFTRYEQFNTHKQTGGDLVANKAYDRNIITSGVDYKIAPGVALKADYQWFDNAAPDSDLKNLFNAGIGIMF
ncbi:MAG: OprO/OprP family phosphate-selective porin [Flavobacteriaceae bacterium]|nr:OprO/OprP family phosphate-selective porin [Flavobacteriaceae bacterium]